MGEASSLLNAYESEKKTGSHCNDPEVGEAASVCIPSARRAVPLGDRDSSLTRTADRKYASLPASCDRWTAGRRSPWPRRFSRPHREFSARLARPPPWRRGTRSWLSAVAASGERSGRQGRSSLGPAAAAARRVPKHAGKARGDAHLTSTLRELGPPESRQRHLPRPGHHPSARGASDPRPRQGIPHLGVRLPPAFSGYIRPVRAPRDRELQLPDDPALGTPCTFPLLRPTSFLSRQWLVNRLSLGEAAGKFRPNLSFAHNPFLSRSEVYADASGSRGARHRESCDAKMAAPR